MTAHFDSPTGAVSVLDGSLVLPATVLRGRAVAGGDEDAVTLAAEAALPLLAAAAVPPGVLILVTTSPPYDEGGSVQALAELTGLAGDIVALELTSSLRDGLTAIRLAAALVAANGGTALVCAAHRSRGEKDAGDGAAALLLGRDGGVATVHPVAARAEELRDRWRLQGETDGSEGDPSFVWDIGVPRVAREWGLAGAVRRRVPIARAAGRAERTLGGAGDELAAAVGVLGAAHALGRLAARPRTRAGRRRRRGRAGRGRRVRTRPPGRMTLLRGRAPFSRPRGATPRPSPWTGAS